MCVKERVRDYSLCSLGDTEGECIKYKAKRSYMVLSTVDKGQDMNYTSTVWLWAVMQHCIYMWLHVYVSVWTRHFKNVCLLSGTDSCHCSWQCILQKNTICIQRKIHVLKWNIFFSVHGVCARVAIIISWLIWILNLSLRLPCKTPQIPMYAAKCKNKKSRLLLHFYQTTGSICHEDLDIC